MPLPPEPFVCVELLFLFSAGRGGWELVVTEFPVQTFIGYKIECLVLGFIFLMNVQICVSPCPPRLWPVGIVSFLFIFHFWCRD